MKYATSGAHPGRICMPSGSHCVTLAIARSRDPTPIVLKMLSSRLQEEALGAHLSSPRFGPRQHRPARGCQSGYLQRCLLKKQYSLNEIEEMTRINDQAEEHAKKMEARKLEKRKQAFRLQTRKKERLSLECWRMPKSTNYP
ncbi:hypothetical protein NDU88_000531 [Pleurodeles waltl]|uniref:Uncharacterized protein n=1 Tax=Pleurodeles waltl TaxID=8319 RepID=A0AAV7TF59_PLEWA|nr:hypothetical protein NDU88_000531 [Pleurodeles waltl]